MREFLWGCLLGGMLGLGWSWGYWWLKHQALLDLEREVYWMAEWAFLDFSGPAILVPEKDLLKIVGMLKDHRA